MTSSSYTLQDHQPLVIPIQVRRADYAKKFEDEWITLHSLISSYPYCCGRQSGDDKNEDSGSGSSAPYDSSRSSVIATLWQASTSDRNQQRIAVYAGSSLFDETVNGCFSGNSLHVSFQLPDFAHPPPSTTPHRIGTLGPSVTSSCQSVLCWTSFPKMHPTHQVLCCLVAPTSLCIWDVYPHSSSGERHSNDQRDDDWSDGGASVLPSEGWTITLPFECRAIFAVPGGVAAGGGLLLQRLEDIEDHLVMQSVSANDDDGFLLKGPPIANKSQHVPQTVVASTMVMEPQLHFPTAISNAVPSLFSLQHPLEDVLPVLETSASPSLISSDARFQSHQTLLQGFTSVTDVFEQLLWVGPASWVDRNHDETDEGMMTTQHSAALAVTYHTALCRHAIWRIDQAPVGPNPPPLHKIIASQYRTDISSGILDTHNDLALMDDMQLIQESKAAPGKQFQSTNTNGRPQLLSPNNVPPRLSRAEALADALGVRRTPRKSIDMPKARYRSSDHQTQQHHNTTAPFFSPTATSPINASTRSSFDHIGIFGETNNPHVAPFFPTNRITSTTAVTCIFRELSDASAPAENIFLTTNLESSSKLLLCLVCKRKSITTRNGHPKELKLFALIPDKLSTTRTVRNVPHPISVQQCKEIIGCVSAQPVDAVPIPVCFQILPKYRPPTLKQSPQQPMATDILVLDKHGTLTLYRSFIPIVSCCLSNFAKVVEIKNSVASELTFRVQDDNLNEMDVRGKLSLLVENNSFVEKIISVIESSLHTAAYETNQIVRATFPLTQSSSHFFKILALKIRADCNRMAQSLVAAKSSKSPPSRPDTTNDFYLLSVRTVLHSIADQELLISMALDSKKVAQPSNLPENDDVWTSLLMSDYHQNYSTENSFFLNTNIGNLDDMAFNRPCKNSVMNKLTSIRSLSIQHLRGTRSKNTSESNIFARLFDSLHLLYEELKLYLSLPISERRHLATLLVELCQKAMSSEGQSSLLSELFMEHYRLDFGDEITVVTIPKTVSSRSTRRKPISGHSFTSFLTPPSIFTWLDGALQCSHEKLKYSSYDYLTLATVNACCTRTRSVLRVFSVFLNGKNISDNTIERDFNAVKILIEDGFIDATAIRDDLPPGISLPILELLYRCRNLPLTIDLPDLHLDAWSLIGRNDIRRNIEERLIRGKTNGTKQPQKYYSVKRAIDADDIIDKDLDGLASIEVQAALLFREDNRVHEAARLLRSSRPIFLRVPRAVEVTDHDYERLKQERLMLLCARSLALPIGRGMLTFGSLCPVPAELLPIPELCMKGRVPPTNATLNLDTSESPSDMRVWPEFHNGVAAGLRLPVRNDLTQSGFKITRTWIVYNRPPGGRSSTEDSGEVINQQSQQKSFAHGGLLLALGLQGYLTALEMSDIYDYLTHGTVTTTVGVLLGLSANKRGSCDISVSKMLCLHIPSLIPQHFSAIDVASSVQTAAVIGAGLLFQKSSHRMMTEFLINEIGKRPDSDVSTFDRESYTLACGLALGTVNLSIGEKSENIDRAAGIADLHIEERLYRYIIGGVDIDENRRTRESNDRFSLPSASGNDNERCSTIYEGNQINTDMTAPGATLALGLMYMKTGNQAVASALALPSTHFLLEFVRPDFLGLRVLAKALILWDDVQPDKAWIETQVPAVVRDAYHEMRSVAKLAFSCGTRTSKPRPKPEYDRRSIRQVYAHIVAGACFGMGIRFAGTGDEKAKAALYDRVVEFHALRESNDPVSLASKPELPILEMCLGCVAISLAMVLAGTGDLDALRLFKLLRWRCDKTTNFGSHMIYGMAIGLLFLGGGTCTLGRKPEDIACLITAFFPRLPTSTSDNQYHLQAMRHLYALAVIQKELHAIDVDTGESACLPVDIFADAQTQPQRLVVPALLRNTDKVLRQLRVASEQFYPLKLDITNCDISRVFYVKRKSTIFDDMITSSLCQTTMIDQATRENKGTSSILKTFATYLCRPKDNTYAKSCSLHDFGTRSLLECIVNESDESLFLYLYLRQVIDIKRCSGDNTTAFDRNIKLLQTYYKQRKRLVGYYTKPLLNTELLLPYLQELMELKRTITSKAPKRIC